MSKTFSNRKRRTNTVFLTAFWVAMLMVSLLLLLTFLRPFSLRLPTQTLTSLDWAGYSVTSDLADPQPEVTGINGSWTVPKIAVSTTDTFSAIWIGIGGQLDETLIQTGTEQDSINGTEEYSAWYELLPDFSIVITTMNISPGDKITASIRLHDSSTNEWNIKIADTTNGQSFQQNIEYASSRLSAEWIVERPTVDHTMGTLADFGSTTFTSSSAIIQNKIGYIKDFPYSQIIMQDRQNRQLAAVLPLNANGSSFTITYSGARATQSQPNEPIEGRVAIAHENNLTIRLRPNSKANRQTTLAEAARQASCAESIR